MARRIAAVMMSLLLVHVALPLTEWDGAHQHEAAAGQRAVDDGHSEESCPLHGHSGDACPEGCACLCCPGHGTVIPASGEASALRQPAPVPARFPPPVPPASRDRDGDLFRPPRA